MTVRPATPDVSLPDLVLATRDVVLAEGEALRAVLGDLSGGRRPGCRAEQDGLVWSAGTDPQSLARQALVHLMSRQARLICSNAYDHLLTLGRSLGTDGAMPLFAHSSLSRVVCEAAVRLAWLLDPAAGSEERIIRGAASLLTSTDEQLRGVRSIPADRYHPDIYNAMIDSCAGEHDNVNTLITQAGLAKVMSKDGKQVSRLALDSPAVSVPVKLNVTEKMSDWLPDSPTWYNLSSGITHSHYWMLRGAMSPTHSAQELVLEPNLMEVAAAGQCAISGSRLIIETIADYYGHDPVEAGHASRVRRDSIDPYMAELAATRTHAD
jgi:hypothetical protein